MKSRVKKSKGKIRTKSVSQSKIDRYNDVYFYYYLYYIFYNSVTITVIRWMQYFDHDCCFYRLESKMRL